MTVIQNEDTKPTASGLPDQSALNCFLEQSSTYRKFKDIVRIRRSRCDRLDISFQQTIRVPDGKGESELPPSMGSFPLYSVANYAATLPTDMEAKGGLFLPMYQREAMWISFKAVVPFAIQIFVGGVNAVSGQAMGDNEAIMMRRLSLMKKDKSIQDYVVTPEQLWLDGIATDNGRVRQFVAMPLGCGYSVEAQVTGQELLGGMQFHVTPSRPKRPTKPSCPPGLDVGSMQVLIQAMTGQSFTLNASSSDSIDNLKLRIQYEEGIPVACQRILFKGRQLEDGRLLADFNVQTGSIIVLGHRLEGGGSGLPPGISEQTALGVAPGGLIKQCILDDPNPATIWGRDRTICFNVQILNSKMFKQVTGKEPPSTPISARTYADAGLPFYKIYGEASTIKGDFSGIKSVKDNGKRESEGGNVAGSRKKAKDCSNDKDDIFNDGSKVIEVDDEINSDHNYESDYDTEDDGEDDSRAGYNDRDMQPFQNPVIVLDPNGSAIQTLTPVAEIMQELSRMKLREHI